ncbi:MAG: DNA topoisomerase 4 subunit A [Acidimicrobiia bacterium]|nr:DNA topoisomerase 4 subunit A [Acidimicrobiia bacterium]MYJ12853.1 DNA topoisomerase 4 subunit A [Acidimicrobiia bacterium]
MSPRQTRRPAAGAPFADTIVDTPMVTEVSESFLAYSLSVITSRAIPDARDGLKPVQRRILYSMLRMGLRPDSPHRKCARVVGDTMGNYHPHGDAAIYDALVRMGQDFSRAVPLVDPQGNFGTLDDPPAAARYTECRLAEAAMEMLDELDEDTVDFRASYDGEASEPVCLPGRLPNLLVNGTSGIAVGMATNMAPHNLREVYEAVRLQMADPEVSTADLLAVLGGPDFPSGGVVIEDGLGEIYARGRGTIRVRARAEIIDVGPRRQAIRVLELPWLVGPEKVVGRIKEVVAAGRLEGVEDVKNLSDRHVGLCIQVDCRPGTDAAGVLGRLWRLTPLEETFALNNVVLAGGVPVTCSLKDLIGHYIDHRLDVVVRRTRHRKAAAEARLHILEGLMTALDNIELVVSIIRGSATAETARAALCERLALSERQAEAVLAMRLRRLAALERDKIVEEGDKLVAALATYRELLASEERRRAVVVSELGELAERHGRPRRSRIVPVVAADSDPAAAPGKDGPAGSGSGAAAEAWLVTLSSTGLVGRSSASAARRRNLGRHDLVRASALVETGGAVWALTSEGRAVPLAASEVPEIAGRSRGGPAGEVFGLSAGERICAVLAAPALGDKGTAAADDNVGDVVLVTRRGATKRLAGEELAGGRSAPGARSVLPLDTGDEVTAAFACPPGADIVIVASDGSLLRTAAARLPRRRAGASGTGGMRLREGSEVIGAGAAFGEAYVIVVTTAGAAKATPASDFATAGRGGMGARSCSLRDGESLRDAYVGPLEDVFALTGERPSAPDGEPVPFPLPPTRRGLVARSGPRPILAVGQRRW